MDKAKQLEKIDPQQKIFQEATLKVSTTGNWGSSRNHPEDNIKVNLDR